MNSSPRPSKSISAAIVASILILTPVAARANDVPSGTTAPRPAVADDGAASKPLTLGAMLADSREPAPVAAAQAASPHPLSAETAAAVDSPPPSHGRHRKAWIIAGVVLGAAAVVALASGGGGGGGGGGY